MARLIGKYGDMGFKIVEQASGQAPIILKKAAAPEVVQPAFGGVSV